MAVLNPSFEDPGALPGEAEHWILNTTTSLEKIAGFGPVPHRAWEDFERWFELLDDFDGLTMAIATFDLADERHEDFEENWDNDIYLFELPTGDMETALFDGEEVEDLESGWANEPYATTWDEVAAVMGQFDGESREDFEDHWRSNESYAWSWSSVASQTALFDAGADNDEDFENGWTAASTI